MSAQELLNQANALFVDEQYEEALKVYSEAIKYGDSEVYNARSACHAKLENWPETIEDCTKAIELGIRTSKLFLRKGIALFRLERYAEARAVFEEGAQIDPPTFQTWIKKATAEIKLAETGSDSAAVTSAQPPTQPAQSQPNPTTSLKNSWYQSADHVIVTIFVKNLPKDHLVVNFEESQVSVTIKLTETENWDWNISLCDKIVPAESSTVVLGTKVEIKLKKVVACRWESLEATNAPVAVRNWADTSHADKPSYPSSAKHKKDWSQLDQEVKKEEAEEKPEGDAALQKLFRDIYAKADEDTRRAMNKSFSESGGTVLSTNWKEVGAGEVTAKPPAGMEAKKL